MTSFAYDYGILSDYTEYRNAPTNLTECFWSEELSGLLSICLEKDRVDIDKMSDYEKFRSFCKCIPLLKRHPTVAKVEYLLSEIFATSVDLTDSNYDDLWMQGSEILSKYKKSTGQLVASIQGDCLQRILCDVTSLEIVQLMGATPLLNGNSLLCTSSTNWDDWEKEMQLILERFIASGCDGVVLTFDKYYQDTVPNPYHVCQALISKDNHTNQQSMLLAQVYRFLSLECANRGLFMILHFYSSKEQTMNFLTRMQASAKLPKTIVSAPCHETAADIMEFCVKMLNKRPDCALISSSYPSEEELSFALAFYKARYPLGRLQFITGHDFRNTGYEIQRIKNIGKKNNRELL